MAEAKTWTLSISRKRGKWTVKGLVTASSAVLVSMKVKADALSSAESRGRNKISFWAR